MSRVGRNPVQIPNGVEVKLAGRVLQAKSKLGERSFEIGDKVEVTIEGDKLIVKPRGTDKETRTVWGTTRSTHAKWWPVRKMLTRNRPTPSR